MLSVMCANNLVNGVYVCENNHTENTILKSWGGFKGWVCSDYDGTRSTGLTSLPRPAPVPCSFTRPAAVLLSLSPAVRDRCRLLNKPLLGQWTQPSAGSTSRCPARRCGRTSSGRCCALR